MTGYNTATLSVPVIAARDGLIYRCVIKAGNGITVTTDEAKLTVIASALKITSQPADYTGEVGETAQFTVAATGTGLTYKWEWRRETMTTWSATTMTGYNTATLSVPVIAARDGLIYRCVITDGNGSTVTSEEAKLSVVPQYEIDGVVYKLIDNAMTVIGYNGSATTVTVRGTVEGYTVTVIGEAAFAGNTTLQRIVLPDSIEIIGKRAFANCTNLSSMN